MTVIKEKYIIKLHLLIKRLVFTMGLHSNILFLAKKLKCRIPHSLPLLWIFLLCSNAFFWHLSRHHESAKLLGQIWVTIKGRRLTRSVSTSGQAPFMGQDAFNFLWCFDVFNVFDWFSCLNLHRLLSANEINVHWLELEVVMRY